MKPIDENIKPAPEEEILGLSEEDIDDASDLSDFDLTNDLMLDDVDEIIINQLEDQGE